MNTENQNYRFRKATLLDIPYIFDLIQEGSFSGSFNSFLMTSKGHWFTLKELLIAVLSQARVIGSKENNNLLIFTLNNEEIGFMKISTSPGRGNTQVIELCAIDENHRNKKHGSHMIQRYIDSLPINMNVELCCTNYSKAMQHILTKLKFTRDKKSFQHVRYVFKKEAVVQQQVVNAEPSKNASFNTGLSQV